MGWYNNVMGASTGEVLRLNYQVSFVRSRSRDSILCARPKKKRTLVRYPRIDDSLDTVRHATLENGLDPDWLDHRHRRTSVFRREPHVSVRHKLRTTLLPASKDHNV